MAGVVTLTVTRNVRELGKIGRDVVTGGKLQGND